MTRIAIATTVKSREVRKSLNFRLHIFTTLIFRRLLSHLKVTVTIR